MKYKVYIGTDDFRDLRENNGYYIDKSLFIKDVIDNGSKVALITRPRRFGKTLNMTMLYHYLNPLEDSKEIFKDLKIMKEDSKYTSMLNNVPVIFISFKDLNYTSIEDLKIGLKSKFCDLYKNFNIIQKSGKLEEADEIFFKKVLFEEDYDLGVAISRLSRILTEYYGIKPYILIDEYDVPLQKVYLQNNEEFYMQTLDLLKSIYGNAFKTNSYVDKIVVTGVSRIVKEGIFSGLNNFDCYTVLSSREFSDDFGFTENEVNDALNYYNLMDKKCEVKDMYDGYKIGKLENIYNPWSITNYLKKQELVPYWVNTSSNDIINKIVEKHTYVNIKEELLRLLKGGEIEVVIDDEVSINNVDKSIENIWSLFLGSGYLKIVDTIDLFEGIYTVKIPNKEIMRLFRSIVNDWLKEELIGTNVLKLLNDLINLNIEEFEIKFKEMVIRVFSYFDTSSNKAEEFYHAFTLGLVSNLDNKYYIKSNKESGYGRFDIELESKSGDAIPSFIFEFKVSGDIESGISEATKQIEEKKYVTNLKSRGINNIKCLVFVFNGKDVTIKEV